jgi:HSP20 family protein
MNELSKLDALFDLELDDDFPRGFVRPWRAGALPRAPQIRIDVRETDTAYAVKADVPGVRKEDIDVRIEGNRVTIGAETKEEKEEKKDGRVLRQERRYGYASRTFTLGSDVDDTKADAKYANGVLELDLPKKAGTTGKRLAVG